MIILNAGSLPRGQISSWEQVNSPWNSRNLELSSAKYAFKKGTFFFEKVGILGVRVSVQEEVTTFSKKLRRFNLKLEIFTFTSITV